MNSEQISLIREEWLPALRSGNYKQGEEVLRYVTQNQDSEIVDNKFCCLGVFADVIGAKWYVNDLEYFDDEDAEEVAQCSAKVYLPEELKAGCTLGDLLRYTIDYTDRQSTLPPAIGDKIGIINGVILSCPDITERDDVPEILDKWRGYRKFDATDEFEGYDLASMNDSGISFNEIADVIEAICMLWEEENARH